MAQRRPAPLEPISADTAATCEVRWVPSDGALDAADADATCVGPGQPLSTSRRLTRRQSNANKTFSRRSSGESSDEAPPQVRPFIKGFVCFWVVTGFLCLRVILAGGLAHGAVGTSFLAVATLGWLATVCTVAVAAFCFPAFYLRHRSALLLLWWGVFHSLEMEALTLFPVGTMSRHLVGEAVFNGFLLQLLELPLRHNAVYMAANAVRDCWVVRAWPWFCAHCCSRPFLKPCCLVPLLLWVNSSTAIHISSSRLPSSHMCLEIFAITAGAAGSPRLAAHCTFNARRQTALHTLATSPADR